MRGLYGAKAWYTQRLSRVLEFCVSHRVSPDALTAMGVLSATLGGVAIAFGWWPLAMLFVAGRLAGANLDGAVARKLGVSRPWGFVVNELGDRLGDMALAGGFVLACAWTPGASTGWAWAAFSMAFLPTFVSLAAAAAGAPRVNGGPFGKTERCAAYVVASLAVALSWPAALTALAVVICVGSLLTAVTRSVGAARTLAELPGYEDQT